MALLFTIPNASELHMDRLCKKNLILSYGMYPTNKYNMRKYNIHVIKIFSFERDKLFPFVY